MPQPRSGFGSSSVFSCFSNPSPCSHRSARTSWIIHLLSVISVPSSEKIMSRFERKSPREGRQRGRGGSHRSRCGHSALNSGSSPVAPEARAPLSTQLSAGVFGSPWPLPSPCPMGSPGLGPPTHTPCSGLSCRVPLPCSLGIDSP